MFLGIFVKRKRNFITWIPGHKDVIQAAEPAFREVVCLHKDDVLKYPE
jgi:hypothetical protein